MRKSESRLCACGKPHEARGLCHSCYQRWRWRAQQPKVRTEILQRRRSIYAIEIQIPEKKQARQKAAAAAHQQRWADPVKRQKMLDVDKVRRTLPEVKAARNEAARKVSRKKQLKRYGLTEQAYQELLQAQGGVCKICAKPPTKQALCVDHDHQTHQIRGLLCSSCNKGLGLLGDSLERINAAKAYLEAASVGRVKNA